MVSLPKPLTLHFASPIKSPSLKRSRLKAMPVRCYCSNCHRTLVDPRTKRNHDRAALKNQTVLQQNVRRPDLASVVTSGGGASTSITVPTHLRDAQGAPSIHLIDDSLCTFVDLEDSASRMDLDIIIPDANYDDRLGSDPIVTEPQFDNHLVEEDQLACQGYDNQEDFPDEDTLAEDQDLDCGDEHSQAMLPLSEPTQDDTDPFLVDRHPGHSIANVSNLPDYLLVIYAMVSWLHMQFSLPCVACNAVLAILACLVRSFNTQLAPPFITLPSITRDLAVDPSIELLPVCPNC